jgi:non-ribosomal peptide synthase protein (TIGR01720 family)
LINTVPSAMAELIKAGAVPETVRRVNLAGEALSRELVSEVYGQGRVEEVYDLYGPTEATTYSTYALRREGGANTIGRPIAGTQIYILDKAGEVVPVGVRGEIYIGGAGVARGYYKRAEQTAERFIPNRFSERGGERLYRSGDIGAYGEDGNIRYYGREDNQVKIKGYRIELGEIEARLKEHKQIEEAVVVGREDERGRKRLEAYIVVKEEVEEEEIKRHLREKLPEYMVPTMYAKMDRLPVSPGGKIDRGGLKRGEEKEGEEKEYREPGSRIEKALARIWMEVLGVERVGLDDNFFELGGDSILSIQIIARANRAGIHLTPRQIFQRQTIRELAKVAIAGKRSEVEQEAVRGDVLLTPIQRWFFEQGYPHPHHFNQAVLLRVDESTGEQALRTVLKRLVEHHDALRLRFEHGEGTWSQYNAEREENEIMIVTDLTGIDARERVDAMESCAEQVQASLNLQTGPLIRVALFELGEYGRRLLIVVHHLAVDGVSWRVLLGDLQTGYEQLTRSGAITFDRKTVSFRRWAEKLAEYSQSEEVAREKDYWLRQARRECAALPIDLDGGDNRRWAEKRIEMALSNEETAGLLQDVAKAYRVQIDEVLLTALVWALRSWTGASRIRIEMEGHGRHETIAEDVSRTVGWFTTLYPVVLDVGGCVDQVEALKAIKEQMREIPGKGIGFGLLKYLGKDEEFSRELGRQSEAEIEFNYLGRFDHVFDEGSGFNGAVESTGPTASGEAKRARLLGVSTMVEGGRLVAEFAFSERVHRRETIENLAKVFKETLRRIIEHCRSPRAGEHTPSDFPLAKLNMKKLRKLPALIDSGE